MCYTPWFDSGYTFGVSLRGLMEDFHTFSVFDVPVVVQRQVHGQTVQFAVLVPLLRLRSLTSLSWRSCRFPWFTKEILQLLYIDKVVGFFLCRSCSSQVQAWMRQPSSLRCSSSS